MSTIGTAIKLNDMMSEPILGITNAMNMMLSAWDSLDSATSSGLAVDGVEAIRSELNRATQALDNMGDEQQEFNHKVQQGTDVMDDLTNKIIGAVSAYVGLQGLSNLVDLSDTYTQTVARLNMINDGLQTTEELQDKIFASAQRAGASYADMADMVSKVSLQTGDVFSSNDEAVLFAENLNKLYAIAGTEQASIASSILQLTQALGSGVLRGEEFNAVFEAAPNIMQTVADYMDVPIGKLREMAADGQITASVVKNAMLSATSDINAQFETMPVTWANVWTGVMNELYYASITLLEVISALAQNWSIIEPIVIGAATAIGLYTAALLVNNAMTAGAALSKAVHAAATAMSTGATFAATAAQHGFNAALLACPLTWIVIALIAVIATIYAIVAAINKVTGSTISATRIIMGAIATAGTVILNTVIGVLNAIIQLTWSIFVEPFISIIEWVLNACNGGFDSFGDAVANLIGQIISWFLGLGKVVTTIIDAIFGTNWTSGLSALQEEVIGWGKNEDAITIERNAPLIDRIEYGDAWDAGYNFGEGVADTFSGFFNRGTEEGYNFDNLTAGVGDVAVNTGAISDSLEITNEDLKYLRDLAEQEVINRFTTAEIRVDMGGINNNVSQNMDLDGVVDYMVTGVREAVERIAEGVHS